MYLTQRHGNGFILLNQAWSFCKTSSEATQSHNSKPNDPKALSLREDMLDVRSFALMKFKRPANARVGEVQAAGAV
jgi:hypothetical protein